MEQTHWKKLTNPDYLGAYSFNSGEEKILTIKQVKTELVTGADGKKEQCTVARFKENEKPMILNRTNCKAIQKIYKTPFIEQWSDKKIQIYVAEVKAFGEVVDALRIKPIKPVSAVVEEIKCEDCGQVITGANGKDADWIANYTFTNYNKKLCVDCATKTKEKIESEKTKDGE